MLTVCRQQTKSFDFLRVAVLATRRFISRENVELTDFCRSSVSRTLSRRGYEAELDCLRAK
jgi:hypothetical protein